MRAQECNQINELIPHSVFAQFPPREQFCPANNSIDYVGATTRMEFYGELATIPERTVTPNPPEFKSEYFEWIDLLESVSEAERNYTFVELGAGFGRWAARAVCAARRKNFGKIRVVLAEAEPVHCKWIHINMAENKVGPNQYRLFEAAVAANAGVMHFCISWAGQDDPARWYGQMLFPDTAALPTERTYYGRPILAFGERGVIEVSTLPLATIIADYEKIDLIDMDIQNAEGAVIQASIDTLNQRVRRIHIATHSAEVEQTIRSVMAEAGWNKKWDFPCCSISETPYGKITFEDGVQGWTNPRFV